MSEFLKMLREKHNYVEQYLLDIDVSFDDIQRLKMIYEIIPEAGIRENDLKPVMSFRVAYKPLWIDDLLWDILGMESNKMEPDSLKLIGAFTVYPARKSIDVIELQAENKEYLESVFYEKMDELLNCLEE